MALPVLRRRRRPEEGPQSEPQGGRKRGRRRPRRSELRRADVRTRRLAGEWTPWSEFAELHDRMGRLLEEAFGADVAAAFRAGEPGPGGWHPGADVQETDDSYVVEIDLPGVRRDDVSVEFGHGELAVTGEVKERERVGLLRHRTRRTGRFDYRIDLPGEVLDDRISASLEDGVLTVRVPKTERARRRRIAIGGGGSTGE